ncbi:MAG: hypothetical protein AAB363_00435 [Planctomycetota bacterium]
MKEALLDLPGLDSTRATTQEPPIGASLWTQGTTVQDYQFRPESDEPDAGCRISGVFASGVATPIIQIVFSPEMQNIAIQTPEGADLADRLRNRLVHGVVTDHRKLLRDVIRAMVADVHAFQATSCSELDSANPWRTLAGRGRMSDSLEAPSGPRAESDASEDVNDRRERYARLSALLDEWASEPPEFDSCVGPLIEEALRESAPRHFPKD